MNDKVESFTSEHLSELKKLQGNWMEALENMSGKFSEITQNPMSPEALKEFTKLWVDSQKKFVESWVDVQKKNIDYCKTMMMTQFPSSALVNQIHDAAKTYYKTSIIWAKEFGNISEESSSEDIVNSTMNMWKKAYKKFTNPVVMMPWINGDMWEEQLRKSMDKPFVSVDSLADFQKNWIDSIAQATTSVLDQAVPSKSGSMHELYSSWATEYQDMLQKYFRAPLSGPNREVIDIYKKSLKSYLSLCSRALDFSLRTSKINFDILMTISDKTKDVIKGEITPDSFMESLKPVGNIDIDDALKATLEASFEFQKDYRDLIEKCLNWTPVVTREEMARVHDDLNQMDRQLDDVSEVAMKSHENKENTAEETAASLKKNAKKKKSTPDVHAQ